MMSYFCTETEEGSLKSLYVHGRLVHVYIGKFPGTTVPENGRRARRRGYETVLRGSLCRCKLNEANNKENITDLSEVRR